MIFLYLYLIGLLITLCLEIVLLITVPSIRDIRFTLNFLGLIIFWPYEWGLFAFQMIRSIRKGALKK